MRSLRTRIVWTALMLALASSGTVQVSAQQKERFLAKDDILLFGLGLQIEPAQQTVPKDIATKLNQKIVEIAKSDDMKKRMRDLNTEVPIQTPEEVFAYLKTDTARNAAIIKAGNIKVD